MPKKSLLSLFFITIFLLVSACTPAKEISEIHQTLEALIPQNINSDFTLPTLTDTEVEWFYQDERLEHTFIYQAPFFDQTVTMEAHVRTGLKTEIIQIERRVVALDSAHNVSRIYIETPQRTMDIPRRDYIDIEFTLIGKHNDHEVLVHQTDEVEMRGRGNSTWAMPKKPYRIRFDEAVSLLDLPAARNYVLLAEYADKSLFRNTIVHKFSSLLENLEHTISTRVVELYLNDQYQGLYILTEHVELAESKLFFESTPGVIDTGYFLEMDQRFFEKGHVDGVDGIVVAGVPYEIVRPSTSNRRYIPEQTEFIRDYFEAMEQALIAQENYEDYLDLDNWIDFFIVQELFKNVDVGWSSVFIYKKAGDVVRLGPLWDFDLAIGNADYIDYAPENWYGMRQHKNRWFQLMMAIPDVRERFKERYIEIYQTILPDFLEGLPSMFEAKIPLAERNFQRWSILDQYVWPNPPGMLTRSTVQHQHDYVFNFIISRSYWMYQEVQSARFVLGRFDS